MNSNIKLVTCPFPVSDIGEPPPDLPTSLFRDRMAAACIRARTAGLSMLAVYGDREHCANVAYLTGFDPRFEEALLLLNVDGRAKLLVGNECMGYLPDADLSIEVELFQEFSLLGQPRNQSRPLRTILSEFGATAGTRIGVVGWKYFDGALVASDALDVPAYLADILLDLCGRDAVTNATSLFIDAQDGLRATIEPEQLAQFEYASGVTASGVLDVLSQVQAGISEAELEQRLDSRGLPLSCHRMISSGDKVRRGLSSPSGKTLQTGEPFVVAFGVAGGLTCRAGCVASAADHLGPQVRDFYAAFAANYFAVVAAWYESVRVGITGGEVFNVVDAVRDRSLFSFAVNPGHQLHLDEWLNSPFSAGSGTVLRSGMALQMDIIPVSTGAACYTNAEDGIALADEDLRAKLATGQPAMWARIQRRRNRLRDAFGIHVHESVLPLTDLVGWFPPYLLDLTTVFSKA